MRILVIMITQIIVIIMMLIDITTFIELQKDSIIAGVFSGIFVGFFSWLIHIIRNTPPYICISDKICHYSEIDNFYRIKIKNNSFSNLKVISVNFIISYSPNTKEQKAKNDIIIATKKEDPLLFGLLAKYKNKNVRTFDTFVIDAQKCIEKETIEKKTSQNLQSLYLKNELTINDFFEEDKETILSAVFYVQNYRTGATRDFCHTFYKSDIVSGKFKSGRSLEVELLNENPKESDV